MRELNRLGVTSVIDAGGGFQNYPQDYEVITALHKESSPPSGLRQICSRSARTRSSTTSPPGKSVKAGQGDDVFRINGAGEMLVYSAADFEDFLEPRPEMPERMERDLTAVVKPARRAPLAVPAARHLRRDHHARAERVRERGPRGAARRASLVHRPRRDDLAAQHRAHPRARRRHRGPAPHGIPGRALHRALRRREGRRVAADQANARRRRPGRRRNRRHARRELQPVRFAVLAGRRKDRGRHCFYKDK